MGQMMGEEFENLLAASQGDDQAAREAWRELFRRCADRIRDELRRQSGADAVDLLPSNGGVDAAADNLFSHRRQLAGATESEFVARCAGILRSLRTGAVETTRLGELSGGTSSDGDDLPPPPSGSAQRRQFDRFEIRDVLGQGGFGTVYRAWDPQLQRQVAIKVPRAELLLDGGARERFLREARAAAALQHPQVCPVHDVCDSPDGFYIVMALVEGVSASQLIRDEQRLPQARAVAIVHDVALGLQAAHEAGIVHRDLKPSNIMIDPRGRAVVMDFGLAVRTGSADPRLTQSGALLGTPAYMSPEQMRGETDIGPASDVYSLGLVLFELLTGKRPHTGRTAADLIADRLATKPSRPSQLHSGIDPQLDAICLRAMSLHPGDRYESMADFAAALEPLIPDAPATSTRRRGELIDTLPLPLARLYRRACNAKTPLERRQLAYYVWEAGLKLLASVVVVEYAAQGDRESELDDVLQRLSRPALGHWWQIVRDIVPRLAERDQGFSEVNDILLAGRKQNLPAAAGLYSALGEALQKPGGASRVRMFDLFERLIEYRNREIGHGVVGARSQEHYDRMARALLTGVAEILRGLDVLAGRRLLYVADVRQSASGDWVAETFELAGSEPARLNPFRAAGEETGALPRTQRLYLHDAELPDGAPVSLPAGRMLHPLIIYDAAADDVLFLNGRAGRKQAEYLSYTSGDTQRQVLPDEQRELLARVLGRSVDEQDIDAWADRSLVEESDESAIPTGGSTRVEPKCIGEFELISVLGEGGMGRVYRAWQPSLGRQVALKRLNQSTDEKARARFTREIRALGRIDHPNIVKVYTSGADADEYFYAMELIEGADLGRVCRHLELTTRAAEIDQTRWRTAVSSACEQARTSERRISNESTGDDLRVPHERFHLSATPITANAPYLASIVDIMRQIAEASDVMHRAGIVHRDIKPGNIMVTPAGDAVLTDLGLAQLADEEDGQITRTRQFVGTLRYASPEQVLAVGHVDSRSDVYSLGATLWELLTLQPLFGATDATPSPDLMRLIQQKEPDSVRQHNESVPKDLEAVVLKCLEKDPDKRYQSAGELAEELSRWQRGDPVRARKRTTAYLLMKSARRHRRPIAGAAAVAAACLIAALFLWLGYVRPSHTYFAAHLSRYRIPEGVRELNRNERSHRNLSYRLTHRGWWGPVVELATVNGHGREVIGIHPIIGDELDETLHVARIRYEYDDHGRILREIGYDLHGNLTWQAVYDHGEPGTCVARFLNARRHLIPLGDSLATSVEMSFDDQGLEREFRYTDAHGAPQPNFDGSFGSRFERDKRGMLSVWTWLNAHGDPASNRDFVARAEMTYHDSEVASVRYYQVPHADAPADDGKVPARHRAGYYGWINEFDAFGNVKTQMFIDGDGNPMRSGSYRYAGVATEFDEHGNMLRRSFLDVPQATSDDSPLLIDVPEKGYASWASEFDDQGRETWRMFFDKQGAPTISTDEGVAGWRSIYDEDGNETVRIFLGVDNEPQRHNDGTAGWTTVYDEAGRQTEVRYFDLSEDLIELNHRAQGGGDVRSIDLSDDLAPFVTGVAGYTYAYYPQTNWISAGDYIGEDGRPTRHSDGEHGWRAEYDERGNRTREWYVDADGAPVAVSGGVGGYRWHYNDLGQLDEYSFHDADDELILNSEGVAGWKSTFDALGNESSRMYFGDTPDKRPVLHRDGYAGWNSTFDGRGNETQRTYFGTNRERVASIHCIGGWKSTFDDRGNETRRVFLGVDPSDDRPALHRDGNFGWEQQFDEYDHVIRYAYLDRDGGYMVLNEGFGGYASILDKRGLEVERRYFGEAHDRPAQHMDGYFAWRSVFDERGNEIERRYVDDDGELTLSRSSGIAGWNATFNQWNLATEHRYVNESGDFAPHRDGNHRWTQEYDVWGRVREAAYRNQTGDLVELGGYALARNTYDTRGNWLTLNYFDEQERKTENDNGIHSWVTAYDEYDRRSRDHYENIDGVLTAAKDTGIAGWSYEYTDTRRVSRTIYFGDDEQPVRREDGTAGEAATYDMYGNQRTHTWLGADLEPTRHLEFGYARYESEFDERHRERRRTYSDENGEVLETRVVVQSVTPGSQAQEAGIEPDDIVVAYDGVEGNTVQFGYLRILLLEQEPRPERVELRLLRDGVPLTVEVKPGWMGVEWADFAVDALSGESGAVDPEPAGNASADADANASD